MPPAIRPANLAAIPNPHDPAEECSKCRFFAPHEDDEEILRGVCLRFPPQLIDCGGAIDSPGSAFPPVRSYAWCGEFRRPKLPPDKP